MPLTTGPITSLPAGEARELLRESPESAPAAAPRNPQMERVEGPKSSLLSQASDYISRLREPPIKLEVTWRGQYLTPELTPRIPAAQNCRLTVVKMVREFLRGNKLDKKYRLTDGALGNSRLEYTCLDSCRKKHGKLCVDPNRALEARKRIDADLERGLPVPALISVYGKRAGMGTDHWIIITGRTRGADGKVRYTINDPGTLAKPKSPQFFEVDEETGNLVKMIDGKMKRYSKGPIANSSYELTAIATYVEKSS